MVKVNVADAGPRLAALIAAALHGERVIIEADAQEVQLVPVERLARRRVFGSARGLIHLAADFDAPLEDFEPYGP